MAEKQKQFDPHVKHLAHQIVAQLSEDEGEALLVLEIARQLVLWRPTEKKSGLRLVEGN